MLLSDLHSSSRVRIILPHRIYHFLLKYQAKSTACSRQCLLFIPVFLDWAAPDRQAKIPPRVEEERGFRNHGFDTRGGGLKAARGCRARDSGER